MQMKKRRKNLRKDALRRDAGEINNKSAQEKPSLMKWYALGGIVVVIALVLVYLFFFITPQLPIQLSPEVLEFDASTPSDNFFIPSSNYAFSAKVNLENASSLESASVIVDSARTNIYDNSLAVMLNFDKISALGENDSFVKDLSGKGNDGDVSDASKVVWGSSGKYNGAYEFSGGEINFGDADALDFGADDFTIALWVKLTGQGADNQRWFAKGAESNTSAGFEVLGNNGASFGVSDGTSRIVTSSVSIPLNSWQYVSFQRSGGFLKVYINGELRTNISAPIGSISNLNVFKLGNSTNVNTLFNGMIDEFRAWNKALSDEEIKGAYFSSLNKYDADKWKIEINSLVEQRNLSYQICAKLSGASEICTETRHLIGAVCTPNWANASTACVNGSRINYYVDSNNCGVSAPADFANATASCGGTGGRLSASGIIGQIGNVNVSGAVLNLTINGQEISNANLTGTRQIEFKDAGASLIEYLWDFSATNLSLNSLVIKKENSSELYGYTLIKGASAENKTIYVSKLNASSTSACIKDAEINSISEISTGCNGIAEYVISCPGASENYSCAVVGNKFKITGLRHSAVREILPSPAVCAPSWTCTNWSECADSTQTRTCADSNNCGDETGKPEETQACVSQIPVCTPSWDCTNWSECADSTQTRTCADSNNCGDETGKPEEAMECEEKTSFLFYVIIGAIIIAIIAVLIFIISLLRKRRAIGMPEGGEGAGAGLIVGQPKPPVSPSPVLMQQQVQPVLQPRPAPIAQPQSYPQQFPAQ